MSNNNLLIKEKKKTISLPLLIILLTLLSLPIPFHMYVNLFNGFWQGRWGAYTISYVDYQYSLLAWKKKNYNLNIRQIKAKDDSVLVKNAFNLLVSLLLL